MKIRPNTPIFLNSNLDKTLITSHPRLDPTNYNSLRLGCIPMSNRAFLCLQRQGVQQFRIREKEGEKTACYQVVNKLLTKSQSYTSQVL